MESVCRETEMWKKRFAIWENETLDTYIEQIDSVDQLLVYLHNLEICLLETLSKGSVKDVFQRFPAVGQLLTQLTACPLLTAHDILCKCVVKCILKFYTHSPTCTIEEKATSWAIRQVRSLCCVSKQPIMYEKVLDITGSSFSQYADINMNIINGCIAKKFSSPPRTDVKLNWDNISPEANVQYKRAVCLAKIFCYLRHISEFRDLLTKILEYIISFKEIIGAESQEIRNVVDVVVDLYKDVNFPLPYSCQVLIWKNYSYSLEKEVLHLTSSCVNFQKYQKKNYDDKIALGYLVKGCATDAYVYRNVFASLDHLLVKSSSDVVLFLKYYLHDSICQYVLHQSHVNNGELAVTKYFPAELRPVVHYLIINPVDLSRRCCEYQVKQISKLKPLDLKEQQQIFVRHKFLSWQYTALALCLLGSRQIIPETLETLHLFHLWSSHIQTLLMDFVICLRGLLAKSSIAKAQLSYVHSITGKVQDISTLQVFGQLWMFLLIFSEAAPSVWDEIIQLAIPDVQTAPQQIECTKSLVETIEIVNTFLPIWIKRNVKKQNISSIFLKQEKIACEIEQNQENAHLISQYKTRVSKVMSNWE